MNLRLDDLVTLAVGIAGGVASFLVSTKTGVRQAVSAGFVGGFAGFTFPPVIVYYLNSTGGFSISDDAVIMGISGFVGAIAWQVLSTIQTTIPTVTNSLLRRFTNDGRKDENRVVDGTKNK